jgi:ATP phosphoribosyltransferase regulatory subunit
LRVSGDTLSHERQLTQAGIELIGVNTLQADAEVVKVAVESLEELGLNDLSIDFSLPKLKEMLIKPLGLDAQSTTKLEDAIAHKDPKMIRAFAGEIAPLLLELVAPSITLESFLALPLQKEVKLLANQLEAVITLVRKVLPHIHPTIDPLESRNGGYHTGVAFSLFAKGAKGEIGRGGRYSVSTTDVVQEAVGCTLYVNMLRPLLSASSKKPRVYIPVGSHERDVRALRAQNHTTVYALDVSKDEKKEARLQQCDAVLIEGKITKV